jgi:hypothetical protein
MIRTALVLSFISTTSFAATYSVVPIQGPSGWANVQPSSINNYGQVAGTVSSGNSLQVFIGSPSGSTVLPLPSGWSFADAAGRINASGQVAITVNIGTSNQAFIGTTSGSTAIPLPAGWSIAFAAGVNDFGQVTGYGAGNGISEHAFIGTTSGSTAVPLPAGWTNAYGTAVNNGGQVAGSGQNAAGYAQGFIGAISGSTALPFPFGVGYAQVTGLNNSGQVVGVGPGNQVFIGTVAGNTAIPPPAGLGDIVEPFSDGVAGISDLGVVVGGVPTGGWIWDAANGTRLLTTLVPTGWRVTNAISISNNGLILAQASYQGGASQYVELIPAGLPATPAPLTLALVLIGLALCSVWWAQHRRASFKA